MRAGSAQIRYSSNIESRDIRQRLFISSLSGYPGFCLFTFSCFPAFFSGFFSTRGMEGGPAECLYQQNSDQCTAAVNTHISYRWTAGIDKRLVIFIQTCKSRADRRSFRGIELQNQLSDRRNQKRNTRHGKKS